MEAANMLDSVRKSDIILFFDSAEIHKKTPIPKISAFF
jgi:hypothetical protein